MRYELMIVATVEKGDSLVSRVEKAIKENESNNLKVDRLGKKPLAYPIKKQTDANFYLLNFEASPDVLKSLTDKLRLEQDDLLRYLILKNVEKKSSSRAKKVVKAIEVEMKEKPKVTVAVKKVSRVKSTKVKSIKSTRGTKGKSKK